MKSKSLGIARGWRIRLAVAAVVTLGVLLAPGAALAGIVASTTSGTAPLTVDFSDDTVGAVSSSWTFGDGTSATGSPTSKTYQSPGTYTVTLISTDALNVSQEFKTPITVLPPPPTAAFSATPNPGTLQVKFTDQSTGSPTNWQWDFGDNQQSTQRNPSHTYAADGTYTVTLTVSNAGGSTSIPHPVTVKANHPPTAGFTMVSNPAAKDTVVGFDASASTDLDRDPLTYLWDFNNDGQVDAAGRTVFWTFHAAGSYLVRLRVSDGLASASQDQILTVLDDKPPIAGFSFTPPSPSVGQNVTFTSSSSDPDGSIVKLEWDLDGDGAFNDAQGPVAQWSYSTPGPRFVSLKATDDKGVAAIAFQTINVTGPPPAETGSTPGSGPPTPASSPSPTRRAVLNPFPIIHIRARVVGGLVHIDLLTVKAPSGATVQVRCHGKTCPLSRQTQRVRRGAKTVRFRRLEKRVRAGTVLEIFVTGRGAIGKYTRFKFRPGAAPARRDLCLPAGSMRPGRCPAP